MWCPQTALDVNATNVLCCGAARQSGRTGQPSDRTPPCAGRGAMTTFMPDLCLACQLVTPCLRRSTPYSQVRSTCSNMLSTVQYSMHEATVICQYLARRE